MQDELALQELLTLILDEFKKNGYDLNDINLETLEVVTNVDDPLRLDINFDLLDNPDTE